MQNSFFSIFCFCHNLLPFSSPGKLLQMCDFILQLLMSSQVTFRLLQKSLVEFVENFYRKKGLFGKFFVYGIVFLYLTHSCQLLEPRCFETAIDKTATGFRWFLIRLFKFCYVLFEFRIISLNFRCRLMVVFCLLFPEFAESSLVLHNHLVEKIKSLSN